MFHSLLLRIISAAACLSICMTLSGCAGDRKASTKIAEPIVIKKLVVFGFSRGLAPGSTPDVIRDPISGSLFSAEPVPEEGLAFMNENLFTRILALGGYELVSPSQAQGVYQKLIASGKLAGSGRLDMLREIGLAFGADAVLAGYLYRWQEREGTDFAVNRPASVAFSFNLLSPPSGELIWHNKFDKTQQSLTENIFDFKTFVKGKGRWMTARQLAEIGLEGLVAAMPLEGD